MIRNKRHIVIIAALVLALGPFVFYMGVPKRSTAVVAPHQPRQFLKTQISDKEEDFVKVTYDTYSFDPRPLVLFLSSVGSSESYGLGRTFADLYKTFESQFSNEYTYSFGFLFGTEEEFAAVDKLITTVVDADIVSKVTLIYAPFLEKNLGFDRANRHANEVQRKRRRNIARSRNFLLYNSLEDQHYTMFLDSDVVEFTYKDTMNRFIELDLDVIVPRVVMSGFSDYDRNLWRGDRAKPNEDQYKMMDENRWDDWDKSFVPHDVKTWHFFHYMDNVNGEKDLHEKDLQYHVPLDAVGGAVLYAKSLVYRAGAMFPTSYIIGTEWSRNEGYDGIETEGLCYLARPLGYKCYGFPNLVARHDG